MGPLVRSARSAMGGTEPEETKTAALTIAETLGFLPLPDASFFSKRLALFKKTFAAFDAVVSPSHYLLSRYNDAGIKIPSEKLTVVPYGVDPDEAPADRGADLHRPFRFGLVGHMNHEKGLDLAIRAFRDIDRDLAELHVYGDVTMTAGEKDGNRGAAAKFHGPFMPEDLPGIWAALDVLIVPSIWVENAPKVVHEAFAAGVPVIAANHGSCPNSWTKTRRLAFQSAGRARARKPDPASGRIAGGHSRSAQSHHSADKHSQNRQKKIVDLYQRVAAPRASEG
ncbi:MAG: glycosyltransferase [Deltaproteobacteria bacterium]|nr:glycosyltransferase [Deltaproteobacteria bacterium]